MPFKCRVCSNSDYNEIDGLYYCTECQTQCEDMILQEASQHLEYSVRNEVKLTQSQSESSRKKPKSDLGRPWTIYEAYQVIILAQADSLIALGARKDLKDIVFTIWANYLSNLGVAFCKKEKLVPDIVAKTKIGRIRELHRGTLSNPLNRHRRDFVKKRERKTAVKKNAKKPERVVDDKDSIVFMDDCPDDVNRTLRSRQSVAMWSPEWMNLSKTLAMCYVGLMFTNPNFLPCDVVRYAYESKIPYLSVTHLLPSDMVLSNADSALFESPSLDSKFLITEVNKLLAYLELDNMPRPDLTVLIPRFLQELCLPDELTNYCFNLMRKVPFLWKKNTKTGYYRLEEVAMGFIILALKLAVGLDGSTEQKLSKFSHKLQKLLQPEVPLFVWSDWKLFMMRKKQDEFSAFEELTSSISKTSLQHLDEILDCYSKTERDKRRHSSWRILNSHNNLKRCFQPDFRNSLRKPLDVALERLQGDMNIEPESGCRSKEDLAIRSRTFQRCTLNHIVNIEQLQEEVSSESKAKFEKILKKYFVPRTEMLQYNMASSEESLVSERHENYLWLLRLASCCIDCSMMELEKIIVHLQNFFILTMNGEVKPNFVCSQSGHFCASEKKYKKELLFPS